MFANVLARDARFALPTCQSLPIHGQIMLGRDVNQMMLVVLCQVHSGWWFRLAGVVLIGTEPLLRRDATRVRVPSNPGESSSNGRLVAKARGVDPVMSVPFVQGSLLETQTGNRDPMSVDVKL